MLISLAKRQLAKGLVASIFYIVQIKTIVLTFIRVKILRLHLSTTLEGEELVLEKKKILILALYPRMALLPSVKRLVRGSMAVGYHPLVVLNQSRDSKFFEAELKKDFQNITLISRKNIGRDFGAYQCAFKFLESSINLKNLSKLAFFNDSIFYGKDFTWFKKLDEIEADISALYSNFELKPHFQSMAFICNQEVISSSAFRTFWAKYYPSEIRMKVIKNGELRLSTVCINAGFTFTDLATKLLTMKIEELNDFERQSILMFGLDLHPQKNLMMSILRIPDFPINQNFEIAESMKFPLLSLITTSKNMSHAMAHYFTRHYSFPLKMDLLKFGTMGILDLSDLLDKLEITKEEAQELLFLFRSTGSYYGLTGWAKLFRDFHLT
jgi:Rhamnan synthesis protein F